MDAQSNVRIFDSVLANVCSVHNIDAIKDLQQPCLKLLTQDKKVVLACLPTGYRKSLIYQAWPTICDLMSAQGQKSMVLVVPLHSKKCAFLVSTDECLSFIVQNDVTLCAEFTVVESKYYLSS